MSESEHIPQIQKLFNEVAKELKSTAWFKKDKWMTSNHLFPSTNPQTVTFHVFKPHWYNHERQGIHIESFLYIDEKKRKKSSVTIHLLHYDFIPGTKIKRIELSKRVVDAIYEKVSTWDGYSFRAGKYGLQPFTRLIDGKAPHYKDILIGEITALCKIVGPAVDRALKDIVP